MMRNPFYLGFVLLTCGYLAAANLRGWNPFYSAAATLWRFHPNTTHK